VGKTEVAVLLAERFGLSILSVDSRQIYRRLERGTAKPGAEERARAEHLLLDRLEPTETCSAGKYLRMAEDALEDLAARGRAALAVGGAGLYWEALAGGLHSLPVSTPESRARWEAVAEAEGVSGLLSRLRRVDPARASQLGPRDRQRILRALEVCELAGRPMSALLAEERGRVTEPPLPVIALLRDRAELYRRIEQRCRLMLDSGLLEELRGLLASGVPAEAPGLRTVGYREFLPHLLEGKALPACVEDFRRATRRYAKRQETWLRRRLPARVEVRIEEGEPAAVTAARVAPLLGLEAPAAPGRST